MCGSLQRRRRHALPPAASAGASTAAGAGTAVLDAHLEGTEACVGGSRWPVGGPGHGLPPRHGGRVTAGAHGGSRQGRTPAGEHPQLGAASLVVWAVPAPRGPVVLRWSETGVPVAPAARADGHHGGEELHHPHPQVHDQQAAAAEAVHPGRAAPRPPQCLQGWYWLGQLASAAT